MTQRITSTQVFLKLLFRTAKFQWAITMKTDFDPIAKQWIAFMKKCGKPYLAYAPTMAESISLVFQMIEEDENDKTIPEESS